MKSDFLLAITQLSAEKNLPKDVVLTAVEAALASAYKKDLFSPNQNIEVKISPTNGQVEVWVEKTVVEKPEDTLVEIALKEARKIDKTLQVGDVIMIESTPENAGRIAVQTAKQVILQRLHEAEHSAIFEEFADKEGEVVSGVVQRFEAGQVLIDLGRTEAVLPASEQVRTERYRIGQRLKVVLLQVARTIKGPRVIVSRSHPELLKRLFELEVPEVYNGSVEIKSVAREAGFRSKIAVSAKQTGIDPVGCCVGLRGIRIQNIVGELSGEKIDVVQWATEPAQFIANALSPAHIVGVELNPEEQVATVIVPDRQLSLAIGKEGQNARLAAKLTGWRIDIKNASLAESERLEAARTAPQATAAVPAVTEAEEVAAAAEAAEPVAEAEPVAAAADEAAAPAQDEEELLRQLMDEEKAEEPEAEPITEETLIPPAILFQQAESENISGIRFAEDIMTPRRGRGGKERKGKGKKKKGGGTTSVTRETNEEAVRARRGRVDVPNFDEDEESS